MDLPSGELPGHLDAIERVIADLVASGQIEGYRLALLLRLLPDSVCWRDVVDLTEFRDLGERLMHLLSGASDGSGPEGEDLWVALHLSRERIASRPAAEAHALDTLFEDGQPIPTMRDATTLAQVLMLSLLGFRTSPSSSSEATWRSGLSTHLASAIRTQQSSALVVPGAELAPPHDWPAAYVATEAIALDADERLVALVCLGGLSRFAVEFCDDVISRIPDRGLADALDGFVDTVLFPAAWAIDTPTDPLRGLIMDPDDRALLASLLGLGELMDMWDDYLQDAATTQTV